MRRVNDRNGHFHLAQRMSQLAVDLQQIDDESATLGAIVSAAVDMVPGAAWAGIALVDGKQVTPAAASHELVTELDELQATLGEGPAVTAIHDHAVVRINDLGKPDQPWPHFAEKALRLGVHSMLSIRLYARNRNFGALTLYGEVSDAFDEGAEILADLLSDHAAVALAGVSREEHLSSALVNRDVLGQAKGILMERNRITSQQAFNLLVRASQELNIKVATVARMLVDQAEDGVQKPR